MEPVSSLNYENYNDTLMIHFNEKQWKKWQCKQCNFINKCQCTICVLHQQMDVMFYICYMDLRYISSSISEDMRCQKCQYIYQPLASSSYYPITTVKYLNFNLFDPMTSTCDDKYGCDFTKRILYALKYYSTLDTIINDNCDMLVEFCNQTYKSFLDDYIHVIEKHNDGFDDITHLLIKQYSYLNQSCNAENCPLLLRHHRDRKHAENEQTPQDNDDFIFYRDILDDVHCYLCHLYDTALRVDMKNFETTDKDTYLHDENDKYFDITFSNICDVINSKTKKLKEINGFNLDGF
eukprot:539127_1